MKKLFQVWLMVLMPLIGSDNCTNEDSDNHNKNDPKIIASMNGITSSTRECIVGQTSHNEGSSKKDYYKFTVATDGQLNIIGSSPDSDDYYYLEIGSPSDTNKYYGGIPANSHASSIFLRSGEEIYIRVEESGTDTDIYQLNFDFNITITTPPTPEPSGLTTGTCYAMSDDSDKFYIVSMDPGASILPKPIEKSMSREFDGEGSAYRASDNKLYAFDEHSTSSDLYTIDVETEIVSLVKKDLLMDSVDGAEFYYDKVLKKEIFYVTSGEISTELHAFDTTDWSILSGYPKGLDGDIKDVSSIAINPISGEAYGVDDYNIDDRKPILFKIDLATGQTTKIIELKEIVDAEGLAFASDGNLYVEDEEYIDGRKIYKIDLTDGSLTPSAELGGSGDIEGLSCNGMELAHKSGVSGHVYNDLNGLANVSEKIGIENAKVSIYDESGTVVDFTRTDADGAYQLFVEDGNYSIVVDSKTLHSHEDVWMEQTYAPKGGVCKEQTLEVAGACYGGKRGNYDDDNSSLESIEHIAGISVNNESIEDIDFGFSANVVVNTEDSRQGSLRQFIKNANAIDGANVMKFAPSVVPKNETSWWSITLESPLPSLTSAGTVIDGATTNDENSGQVTNAHDGEKVGTNEIALPNFNKPELEINANDMANENGVFVIEADDITISHIALYNAPSNSRVGILIKSGENSKIIGNFIGSHADGSEPQESSRLKNAINHDSAKAVQITDNFIAYIDFTGIWADNNAYIANNSLYKASNLPLGDAITTQMSAGEKIVIENNRIEGSSSYGIESWNSPSIVTIRNNTLIANGQDTTAANEGENGGIRVYGENSVIEYNIIRDHVGAGIVVTGGKLGNKISQNSIYNNGGLGIDIDLSTSGNRNGDGVTVNNGTLDGSKANNEMDYPVFTLATLSNGTLNVQGYIGTEADQAVFDDSRVEVFIADANSSDVSDVDSLRDDDDIEYIIHGEGKHYLGYCSTSVNGNFNCSFTVSDDVNLTSESFIVGTATGSDDSTSEFGANMVVSDAPTGEFSPFTCDSSLYLSNSNNLGVVANTGNIYLYSIDISLNPFEFPAIGQAYNKTYNALAYNINDDYLYALYEGLLLRIDRNGVVQELGNIEGITQQHYSGTFDKKGYYYVGNWSNKSEILKIDIEKRQIVSKIDLKKNIEYGDMTISNDGVYLYFVNVDNGKFTKVNLSDSTVTEIGEAFNSGHNEVASIYSDIDNRLFIILDGGGFYEVDADTGERYFISNSPELSELNDGANCPNAPLSFYDSGDAPLSYGAAKHMIFQSLKLGNFVDHEQNASLYYSYEAVADDASGIDDEDSIDVESLNRLDQTMSQFSLEINVLNQTGVTSTLKGWIDFDRNGHFDNDEVAEVQVLNDAVKATLSWNVTTDIEAGKSYLRLRLSEQNNITAIGGGTRGEVEDYTFMIKPRPVLDAWDTELSIDNKMIHTKKVNEVITLSVASLNPEANAFMTNTFKDIKATLFAKVGESVEAVSLQKDVDLSDVNMTDIEFGKVSGAYKKAYVSIRYMDDFNVTREVNSSDIFSIRPDKYKLDIPSNLVAGRDFNLTVKAIDVDGATIENYKEESLVYKLDINETKVPSGCLLGDVDIKEKRAFVDGSSIVTINYSEIGILKFEVFETNTTETEFAHIDYNDGSEETRFITKDEDISSEINPAQIRANYRYETINGLNYTYYCDNPNIMGTRLDVNLTVMNDANETVTNYTTGCYAKDIDISLNFEQTGDLSSAIFSDENGVEQNNIDVNTTAYKYSVADNTFVDGVSGRSLRVNFDRVKNVAKVPLNLKINETKAKINGTNIEDNGNLDETITFIYARAHAPIQQTVVGNSMKSSVQYEVYLPATVTNKALYGMDGLSESHDGVDWDILPNDAIFGYTVDPKSKYIGVTISGFDPYTIPLTATKIPHSNRIVYTPHDYLIYNRWNENATTHSFQVQFFNDSDKWAGKGKQGMTIKKEGSRRGNMKMDW